MSAIRRPVRIVRRTPTSSSGPVKATATTASRGDRVAMATARGAAKGLGGAPSEASASGPVEPARSPSCC